MVDAHTIRDRFRSAVGTQSYGKFVRGINEFSISAGRLRYWQQKLWEPFAESEQLCCKDAEVIRIFLVCCVHGDELRPVSLQPRPPRDPGIHIDPAPPDPGELRAHKTLFPMAFVRVQPAPADAATETGWYCQTCKDTELAWRTEAFKQNINTDDCPAASLYIDNLSAKYPGETPLAKLVRYYSRWRLPDKPVDAGLLKLRDVICSLNRDVRNDLPISPGALTTAAALFSFQSASAHDRSIHDHCKMHYIALSKIAAAYGDQVK